MIIPSFDGIIYLWYLIYGIIYRIFPPNTKVDTCEAQCEEARINSEELELSLAGFRKKKSGKFLLEQFPLTSTSYLKEVGQMVSFSRRKCD